MTIHQGRAKAKDMITVFDTILKSAGYEEVTFQFPIVGKLYKSMGENGTSKFYIRLSPVNFQYIEVSIYEDYLVQEVSGVGSTLIPVNEKMNNSVIWSTTSLEDIDIDYIININKDRAIIFVEGEETDTRSRSGLCYVGIPIRYDVNDTGSSLAGIASLGSITAQSVAWFAQKNKALINQFAYTFAYYTPSRSYGIGEQLFSSPLIIGSPDEGPRGEIDDLLFIKTPDNSYEARHKDTFIREGKTYIILGKFYNTAGSLPTGWYALRI